MVSLDKRSLFHMNLLSSRCFFCSLTYLKPFESNPLLLFILLGGKGKNPIINQGHGKKQKPGVEKDETRAAKRVYRVV